MEETTWDEIGRNFAELGRSLQASWDREHAQDGGSAYVREAGRKVTDGLQELATHINRTVASPEVQTASRRATDDLAAKLADIFREIADRLESDPHQGSSSRGS